MSLQDKDSLIEFWDRLSLQDDVRFVTLITFTVGVGGDICWSVLPADQHQCEESSDESNDQLHGLLKRLYSPCHLYA